MVASLKILIPVFFAVISSFLSASSYQLNSNYTVFKSCPFLHEDSYSQDLAQLNDVVKGYLKSKIEGNQKCQGPLNSVLQNLTVLDTIFSNNKNPALKDKITQDYLQKQLDHLQLELLSQTVNSNGYETLLSQIDSTQSAILANQQTRDINVYTYRETSTNIMLNQAFYTLNNAINSLTKLDPECIEQIGGWEQILPTILSSLSSLSTLSGIPYAAIAGAGLQLISSLAVLLKDIQAKRALRDIIRHKNNKLLACTYYAIQNTACEYKFAYQLSREEGKLRELLAQKYEKSESGHLTEFFTLKEQREFLAEIFFDVAQMGSSVSLNVNLIEKYFRARVAQPETILNPDEIGPPVESNDTSPEADEKRVMWLIKARERGIQYFDQGIPLAAQVSEALADIHTKAAEIKSIEKILMGKRSFSDIKHDLDAKPYLLDQVKRYKDFFQDLLKQKIIPTDRTGVIAEALKLITSLHNFMGFHFNSDPMDSEETQNTKFEAYSKELTERGKKLFDVMADGAVVQITRQSILTIGEKVQNRIDRVFLLIEEEFLRQDYQVSLPGGEKVSFRKYRRDRTLLANMAKNYQNFTGSSKTFRIEDVEVAMKSLEKGFKREIKKMVSTSLKTKSLYYPELNGETGAHLCSLFSKFLQKEQKKDVKSRLIYRSCKKKFKELDLVKILKPEKMSINWDDPCFYTKYRIYAKIMESIYNYDLIHGRKL